MTTYSPFEACNVFTYVQHNFFSTCHFVSLMFKKRKCTPVTAVDFVTYPK